MNKELEGKILEIMERDLEACIATNKDGGRYLMVVPYFMEIAASRIAALMPEPLAVLADRKNQIMRISHYADRWIIDFGYKYGRLEWERGADCDTYPAAEQAAREYLEKLEDVK